ncbi:ribbon-helix-helix protein, CopG family [Thalassomonas viridans]|uniref:Ribbon-helix-helix protein, CopG family n=1 Tax=Thalassomonas viridans TaxID=137584 RepID=A0AAF0CDW0_9GAMM|nr:ribbon-helix-helix protein, CopG family [Thalassomonas viridans]WDE08850.1 ribbon-helix-helix protein, CopG family [Thalassomonas viridans]
MKKICVITIRIDSKTEEAIRALALADDRSVAWIARTLINEALEARKCQAVQDKQH